jgi:hypothetical protein
VVMLVISTGSGNMSEMIPRWNKSSLIQKPHQVQQHNASQEQNKDRVGQTHNFLVCEMVPSKPSSSTQQGKLYSLNTCLCTFGSQSQSGAKLWARPMYVPFAPAAVGDLDN